MRAEKSEGSERFQSHIITCEDDIKGLREKLRLRSFSSIIVAEHESGSKEAFCYILLTL